jgi:hypothetical protein
MAMPPWQILGALYSRLPVPREMRPFLAACTKEILVNSGLRTLILRRAEPRRYRGRVQ